MKYRRVYRGMERVGDQYMGNKSVNSAYGPDEWTTIKKTSGSTRIELHETLIYRRPLKRKVAAVRDCKSCGNKAPGCYYVKDKNGICTGWCPKRKRKERRAMKKE